MRATEKLHDCDGILILVPNSPLRSPARSVRKTFSMPETISTSLPNHIDGPSLTRENSPL